MSRTFAMRRTALFALPVAGLACLVTLCRAEAPQLSRDRLEEPVMRVARAPAEQPPAEQPKADQPTAGQPKADQPREHPLVPVVQMARNGVDDFRLVPDYSATMIKRERIDGKLMDYEYMFLKIRHEKKENGRVVAPFSAYLYFLAPDKVKGREVIYVRGRNNGKLIAHEGGKIMGLVTAHLEPTCDLAMNGNRYPITEIGILNMVERLVEVGERDMKFGECEVQTFEGAKINGRLCKCIQIVHPHPRKNFRFHKVQIFIDDELGLPLRYASWSWPKEPGGNPLLEEEYTYLNLKLNNGFTDADFDPQNVDYKYPTITVGNN